MEVDEDVPGKRDDAGEVDIGYYFAKQPAYPHMSIECLMEDFSAVDFLPCLEHFYAHPQSHFATQQLLPSRIPLHILTLTNVLQ